MGGIPDQFFFQNHFKQIGLGSIMADGEDPGEIEYGSGFLPFPTLHPNQAAMNERLKEVNEQWNVTYPTKLRILQVRFNPKVEVFLMPADEDEDDEEFDPNTGENERSSDNSRIGLAASNGSDAPPMSIDDQSKKKSNLNVLNSEKKLELDNQKIEERTTEVEVEVTTELAQHPIPKSEANNSNTSTTKASGDAGTETDHNLSVIRAIFNAKTLGALLKLQQPKLLPLVRAQIHKRKVSPNLLDEIFSEKFLKLIFDQNGSYEAGIEELQVQNVSASDAPSNSLQQTNGSANGNYAQPEVGENKVKVRAKPGDRGETLGKFRETVPTLEEMLGTESEASTSTPLDLRSGLIRGGGDLPSSSHPHPNNFHPHHLGPKAKPNTPTTTVPRRFPKSPSRPTSVNYTGKVKQKVANHLTPEENKDARKYPLVDTNWLERKIKLRSDVSPSNGAGSVGSTPKKKVVYDWRGRHFYVDASPPGETANNLSRHHSATSIVNNGDVSKEKKRSKVKHH